MRIKKIEIQNFRRFQNTEISFPTSLTLLAGANNSGKTSLVQLLNHILSGKTKNGIGFRDLSITSQQDIMESLLSFLKNEMRKRREKKPDEAIIELINSFFTAEVGNIPEALVEYAASLEKRYITVQFEISYEDGEYIGLFSDYLMNLDTANRSFYFIFQRKVNSKEFRKKLEENMEEIVKKWNGYINSDDNYQDQIQYRADLESLLGDIYHQSLEDFYYYTDEKYQLAQEMSAASFRELFHYHYLPANRKLKDDNSNKSSSLVKDIVDYLGQPIKNSSGPDDEGAERVKKLHEEWVQNISNLGIKLRKLFKENPVIEDQIYETVTSELANISGELKRIGENEISEIKIRPEMTHKEAEKIVKDCFRVFYNVAEHEKNPAIFLEEDSQGLGVSNLLYITIKLLDYKKQYKPGAVNFFVIEEPEVHLHPQMQQVLIDYLQEEFFTDAKQIQAFITTHSNKVVKTSFLENIRVIRAEKPYSNRIVDMEDFLKRLAKKNLGGVKDFFETLFSINFSNFVFADKIILYEGDTEKMYIESLLHKNRPGKREDDIFGKLRKHYIAYAQVGGAYGHKYDELIKELNAHALLFTDLDYYNDISTKEECLASQTTNQALSHYAKKHLETGPDFTVNDILDWQDELQKNIYNKTSDKYKNLSIYCKTQGEKDGYARTLEEALLYQYLIRYEEINAEETSDVHKEILKELGAIGISEVNVFTPFSRAFWQNIKQQSKLEFPIPDRTEQERKEKIPVDKIGINIRRVAASIGKSGKTDFMYSIILNKLQEKIVPAYIKEGLEWLGGK